MSGSDMEHLSFEMSANNSSNNSRGGGDGNNSGNKEVEEKRAKREIANMNERRRMQNINSGFHSLRALLPQKHDGEKLSKAAILQHTSTYIYQLEQEIAKLLSQNSELKRVVGAAGSTVNTNTPEWIKRFANEPPDCPSCKRRKYENNNRLDIDSSPLGGDGSSTESSSEQEVNGKSRGGGGGGGGNHHHHHGAGGRRGSSGKQSANSSSGGNDQQYLRKQLSRIEKQLEEERRIRNMLEEELNYQNNKSFIQSAGGVTGGGAGTRGGVGNYNSAIDSSIADEVEVASESIEIEMHSCPASPPDVLMPVTNYDNLSTIVAGAANVTGAAATTVYQLASTTHHPHNNQQQQQQSLSGISNTATTGHHHKLLEQQQQRVQKQNAIALPIDVPFVAPRDISSAESVSIGEINGGKIASTVATANNGALVVVFDSGSGNVMSLIDPSKLNQSQQPLHSTTKANDCGAVATPQILQILPSNNNPNIKAEIINAEDGKKVNLFSASDSHRNVPTSAPIGISRSNSSSSSGSSKSNNSGLSCQKSAETGASDSAAKSSRQTLDTIVEAIKHLEGDHYFEQSSDKSRIAAAAAAAAAASAGANTNLQESSTIYHHHQNSIKMDWNVDHHHHRGEREEDEKPPRLLLSQIVDGKASCFLSESNSKSIPPQSSQPIIVSDAKIILNSLANGSAIYTTAAGDNSPRPQIIQLPRPNVIVANSVEN